MKYEIERKFLIEMPDIETLEEKADKIITVQQTYLRTDHSGETRRLRQTVINEKTTYYYTYKKDVNSYIREEDERVITMSEYTKYLDERITRPMHKTRYVINQKDLVLEVDVYPFLKDYALLEVEDIDESFKLKVPRYLKIIRDVTEEKEYTNYAIAMEYCKL